MSKKKSEKFPRIGVCVVVTDGRYVLVGKRSRPGSYGEGTFGLPGGHLEFGENMIEGALRELREETGIDYTDVADCCNVSFPVETITEHAHYLTIAVKLEIESLSAVAPEPKDDEISEWRWIEWGKDPIDYDCWGIRLFPPLESLMEKYPSLKDLP